MRSWVLVLLAGCVGTTAPPILPLALIDTTGARVSWGCGPNICPPMPLADTPPPRAQCTGGGTRPGYLVNTLPRIAQLCEVCYADDGTATSDGTGCRPISCSQDADCPQDRGLDCVQGICQNTAQRLQFLDVLTLCLATVPRSETQSSPSPAASAASDLAQQSCPSVNGCAVPPSCRQP